MKKIFSYTDTLFQIICILTGRKDTLLYWKPHDWDLKSFYFIRSFCIWKLNNAAQKKNLLQDNSVSCLSDIRGEEEKKKSESFSWMKGVTWKWNVQIHQWYFNNAGSCWVLNNLIIWCMFALLYETLSENTFLMTDLNPELFF